MKTAQEIFDQLNSIDENVKIDAKRASEIDKSIMETVCAFANEPGLGGGYLLLGAVRTGFKNGLPVYVPENIENPDKIQNDVTTQCSSMFNVRIRIAEMGTHEQLKAGGGIYQKICEIQSASTEEVSA